MTTWTGRCHCGTVAFEIRTEEPLGPYFRCNCSLCARKGAVMGAAAKAAFTVTAGADALTLYQWNTHEAEHYFCSRCGIYTHHGMRGETTTMGVNMACVDGVDVSTLADVPWGNGRQWSVVEPAAPAR